MDNLINLNNKVAIVTGGSRGVGKAIAIKLATYGAIVVIISTQKSKKEAQETLSQLKKLNKDCFWINADLSNKSSGEKIFQKVIKNLGRIDFLINNAGIADSSPFIQMSSKQWERVIKVNLLSLFYLTQPVIKFMVNKKIEGAIVSISSIATHGNPWQENYAASKGGVEAFTRSLASEFGTNNIRVNAVACGPVDTDATKNMNPDRRKKLLNQSPLNRFLKPEEVANAVLFLLSDMSSGITGTVVYVDTGISRV